jgi:FkbH-like protein
MDNIFEDLLWLQKPPEEFSKELANASNITDFKELAKYSLDEGQLKRLYNKFSRFRNDKDKTTPLIPVKIGIISNSTTDLVVPSLISTALRYGISLKVIEAEFNQIAQEAFSENSTFNNHKLDFILVAIDYHGLSLSKKIGDKNLSNKNIDDCFLYIKSIIESLRSKFDTQIIFQNIANIPESPFGSFEGRLQGTFYNLILNLNQRLDSLISNNIFLLDVENISSNIGLSNWHNPTLWNLGKLSFSQHYLPIYAEYICRILAARLGKSRRCLILDLDNTLWGGVIGDDGVEGIIIGNGNPTGEAHLNIQKTALELRERGIVLAVSSKNDDKIARQPFKKHPDMLLKEEHIAVFQANWMDKASNIKAIAKTLSLGLESMVFLDDNPAERMQVRRELPDVAVPELPDNPALYARTLLAAGYFESIGFSDEDLKRASYYQDNAKRAEILSQSSDIDGYLKSLDMVINFSSFDKIGRARIVQLINKSNQFNLTTKRYNEIEIKNFEEDKKFHTYQIRLKDKLGDNGMISIIICKKNTKFWEIDTWLMSCRVLGRKVEIATLQNIIQNAKNNGADKLIGYYNKTERNGLVKDHYKKLGFNKTSGDDHNEIWQLNIKDYKFQKIAMIESNI